MKKIIAIVLAMVLVAVASVGATLAYLTDTDAAVNTFTYGNVAIDLIENFGDNDPETPEKLTPSTGKDEEGNIKNAVVKEVSVKNTGSEKAFVRVHIAIPQILDNGSETFDASQNVLHFNYSSDSVGEGKWNWTDGADKAWNFYTQQIGNDWYNVYVVTYETALEANQETPEKAMHQVYLDSNVTNEDLASINDQLEDGWNILVLAEGAQEEGFDNAFDALNAAFGVPGKYGVDWSGAVKQ